LESRTATTAPAWATSTQLALFVPLRLLLRHLATARSTVDIAASLVHTLKLLGHPANQVGRRGWIKGAGPQAVKHQPSHTHLVGFVDIQLAQRVWDVDPFRQHVDGEAEQGERAVHAGVGTPGHRDHVQRDVRQFGCVGDVS
jgi:hypothetical protein